MYTTMYNYNLLLIEMREAKGNHPAELLQSPITPNFDYVKLRIYKSNIGYLNCSY